jgi:cytochrome c2
MPKQRALLALIVVLAMLVIAAPAWAGGWAVTTLDHLPGSVTAGEPVTVGFVVRQHGAAPTGGLSPTVRAANRTTGESFTVRAVEDKSGHYSATLTFPDQGEWRWWINGFGMDQPMPTLTVLPSAGPPQGVSASQQPAGNLSVIVILAGTAGLVAGALIGLRRRGWGIALAVPGVAVIAVALILPTFSLAPASAATVPPPVKSESVPDGEALFIAKGCVVCHLNSRVDVGSEFFTVNIGPDLSAYSNTPEYLRTWLKDPAELKPETRMPDLGLKQEEIESLIVFLNSSMESDE